MSVFDLVFVQKKAKNAFFNLYNENVVERWQHDMFCVLWPGPANFNFQAKQYRNKLAFKLLCIMAIDSFGVLFGAVVLFYQNFGTDINMKTTSYLRAYHQHFIVQNLAEFVYLSENVTKHRTKKPISDINDK